MGKGKDKFRWRIGFLQGISCATPAPLLLLMAMRKIEPTGNIQ